MSLTLKKAVPASTKIKVPVFIAGIGAVGGTLLKQIQQFRHPKYELHITGYCNSSETTWVSGPGTMFSKPKKEITEWDLIIQKLVNRSEDSVVFVDATGSEEAARLYPRLLRKGIHLVTPSKQANSFEQSYFNKLHKLSELNGSHYKYETTVGAGLPVLNTIDNLIRSGDHITRISGVVSGTMTYLFNQLQQGVNFSRAVAKAREKGYSEPDPREDLSGKDVARKFLILARSSGYDFELQEVEVQNLVPGELAGLSVHDFMNRLPEYDDYWKSRHAKALVNHTRLRYSGIFTPGNIQVGVQEVPADSPLGGLKGTDNLIQINTQRYSESPIVIQGPGAGKEVTAAGVLSDIIEIAGR